LFDRKNNNLMTTESPTNNRLPFSDNDDNVPHLSYTRSTAGQIEDVFFDNYIKFFKTAEDRRRWDIDRDIPWDKTNPQSSELTAQIVESFSAVEMFLPDYTSKIMELVRRSRGRAWFQANWGYEESKHSMVLEEWLLRSGKRSEEDIKAFERTLLGAEWEPPFFHPRQMIIYTMIQELATGLNYTNLRRRAEEEGDIALTRLLKWISADEMAHYNFFRKGVKAYLALEPEETIADLKYVFDNFAMPAQYQIPDWEERGRAIEAAGIYGPRIYLQKVRLPILEDLGVTRSQLKAAGVPGHLADPMADRTEQQAEDAARARRAPTISISPTS
jgi:acyl-[acyl-carrier-protein] desaturase